VRTLYQFPLSHYCEKSRWHLDHKRLAYRVRDVTPGAHRLVALRYGAHGTVPILVDGDRVLDDSTAIAHHLEEAYPDDGARLLPADRAARARVLELEAWFDDVAGPAMRAFFYTVMLKQPRGAARAFFASYGSRRVELLGYVLGPIFERGIRVMYRLRSGTEETSRRAIVDAFDRVDEITKSDPSRPLVGDGFTLADLAAASMLGPLVAPEGTLYARMEPASVFPEVADLCASLRGRPAWAWVTRVYRDHRARVVSPNE
jgi:glutathione S-transferase